jgi:hypothetical protein
VLRWALKLVTRRRRPLGFHNPATDQTVFVSPPDWTPEKLAGYLAVYHEELAAMFGPIERMHSGDGLSRVP